MSNFLQKQGQKLLQNEWYAFFLVIGLIFIPLAAWLSLAVISLITLRKGSYHGLKMLIVGLLAVSIVAKKISFLPYAELSTVAVFILGYVGSDILRRSVNWNLFVFFLVIITLLGTSLLYWLLPDYITAQFQLLVAFFRKADQNNLIFQLLSEARQGQLASYLLGMKALSVVCSALASIMLARHIQAKLYYPQGFKQELMAFKANRFAVLLLFFTVIEAYQGSLIAISCLPLLVFYCMAAGISLLFIILTNKKGKYAVLWLFIPLIIAPYVVLPLYVVFGSLDSLFNFRSRLLSKVC